MISLENIFPENILIHEMGVTEIIRRDSITSFRFIVDKDSDLKLEINVERFGSTRCKIVSIGKVLHLDTGSCNIYVDDVLYGKLEINGDIVTLLDARYVHLEPTSKFVISMKTDYFLRIFYNYLKVIVKCSHSREMLIDINHCAKSKTIA